MNEQKLFYTVCATLIIYGLGSLLQLGSFILPLPFFEIGLFIICIYFTVSVWESKKLLSFLFLLYGLAQFLALEYNYSFFLSDEKLELLTKSGTTDLFKILAHIVLLPILFIQNNWMTIITNRFILFFISLIIFICLFLPSTIWLVTPYLFLIVIICTKRNIFMNSLSFWLYLPLFIGARELSLYFL
jgi:hypothetical protein